MSRTYLTQDDFDCSVSYAGSVFSDIYAFRGMNFAGMDFRGAEFRSSIFAGCDFTDANMDGCKFINVDLRESVFHRTSLVGATFKGALVWAADFKGANFSGATFRRTSLDAAVFSEHTKFPEPVVKPGDLCRLLIEEDELGLFVGEEEGKALQFLLRSGRIERLPWFRRWVDIEKVSP